MEAISHLPPFEREEFMRILWDRFCDESMNHSPTTVRYGKMIAEYQGWDKPKSEKWSGEIITYIGGNAD